MEKIDLIIRDKAQIRYLGPSSEIRADTLAISLFETTKLLNLLNQRLHHGLGVHVHINAFSQGSFVVHLDVGLLAEQAAVVGGILFAAESPSILNLLSALADLFSIKEFLSRQKVPSQERVSKQANGQVVIENNNGSITINVVSWNAYNKDEDVRKGVSKHFSALNADKEIEGYELVNGDGKFLFHVNEEDFEHLGTDLSHEDSRHYPEERVTLTIVKPSFQQDLVWDVQLKGRKMGARMLDEKFQQRVAERKEIFGAGDKLIADVTIRQVYKQELDAWQDKQLEIHKVHRHIPLDSQTVLTLE